MRLATATATAVAAALAVAGCSAGQSSAGPGPVIPSRSPGAPAAVSASGSVSVAPAAAPSSASRTRSPAAPAAPDASGSAQEAPKSAGGNITIARAGHLLPGPMTITPVYCGKLSAAQRERFGTTAAGGLVYRYANHSGTLTGVAKLYVGFTDGSTVAGENYAGKLPYIAPGRSAEGEVDAIGITGQDLTFTGCEVKSYAFATPSGLDPVSYAG